jgi:hypothetical protein
MTSYSSQGYTNAAEINVIPLTRRNLKAAASMEDEDQEMVRIHIPCEQVVKSFEAPTESVLRRKIKFSRKEELKRLKKLDYWIEGRYFYDLRLDTVTDASRY